MIIKIIRHSERLDYTSPFTWLFYFGSPWADSPLTSKGHNDANNKGIEIKEQISNPKIYTSPYTRTLSTATEIKNSFSTSPIIIEPLLSEFQPMYSHKVNLYPKGIPTLYNGQETKFSYPETYELFYERVKFIIFRLIEDNTSDLILITHGELLKVFIDFLQNQYPDIVDVSHVPSKINYLTVISFEYDKATNTIIKSSIKIK